MAKNGNKKRRLSALDRVLLVLSVVLIGVSAGIIGYVSLMNWKPLSEVDESGNAVSIDESILTAEENRGRVEFLAAAYAARLYDLIQSGGPDEVKLGDVSLSGGGGSGSGALLAMAYALAADCLTAGPGPGLAGCP